MTPEQYKKDLAEVIKDSLDKLAMMQYSGQIKGALILVVDNNHVFRLMEAYGSDTGLAMNAALDIAKDSLINTMKRKMEQAPEND